MPNNIDQRKINWMQYHYPTHNKVVGGVDWFHSVRPPACPSALVCPCKDLWSRSVSAKPFSHCFAIKQLPYGTSCHVCSTACRVLDGLSPYLALIIISMRGYVTQWHLILTYIFKGYLAMTLPISWIIFIWCTNTTHEGTMCHISLLSQ